jgi:hypothetical protein
LWTLAEAKLAWLLLLRAELSLLHLSECWLLHLAEGWLGPFAQHLLEQGWLSQRDIAQIGWVELNQSWPASPENLAQVGWLEGCWLLMQS